MINKIDLLVATCLLHNKQYFDISDEELGHLKDIYHSLPEHDKMQPVRTFDNLSALVSQLDPNMLTIVIMSLIHPADFFQFLEKLVEMMGVISGSGVTNETVH